MGKKEKPKVDGRGNGGLTFIEVLCAVAIIGVLAAVLLPASLQFLERSRATQCASNLRNIGSVLGIYARERGANFEVWYQGSVGTMWNTRLITDGYVTRDELRKLSCPSIAYASPSGSISGRHYGVYMNDPQGRFETATDSNGLTGKVYRLNVVSHPEPSKSLFLADSVTSAGDPTVRILNAPSTAAAIHIRHGDRANLFFLDGHVETAGPAELRRLGVGVYYTKDLQPILLP